MSIFEQLSARQAAPARGGVAVKPVLPRAAEWTDRAGLQALRRFHLGLPPDPAAAPEAAPLPPGLVPALLHPFRNAGGSEKAGEPAERPLLALARAAIERVRAAREGFRSEALTLAEAADALLATDRARRPESRQADALGGAMGELGARFVDPSALAGVVGARPGAAALPNERRQRLERAAADLRAFADGKRGPEIVVVHDDQDAGPTGAGEGGYAGWRIVVADDPCAEAAGRFDEASAEIARLLAAARLVRLESDGVYDPARHDPWLARLDWQSFSRDELALVPAVVAAVSADQVARRGILSLSRLLLSGRPVQVLVAVDPAGSPGTSPGDDPLAGFRFEPGYLGIGHREAFVQQGSAALAEHLAAGFARAAGAARTALHVVAMPAAAPEAGGTGLAPETLAAAAVEGRAHPLFRYDPEAGASWARRLDFAANPAPVEDWPHGRLAVTAADGGESALDLAFTYADYALLDPASAAAFRPVAAGTPEGDLVALAAYLELEGDEGAYKIPFVWAADAQGRLHRLAVTRRLALACRDRLDFWRTLQELAGVRSEYVREAEERLRAELTAEAGREREALEARHADELAGARRRAVEEVVDRLTASILDVEPGALGPLPGPASGLGWSGGVEEVSAALGRLVAGVDPTAPPPAPAPDGNGTHSDPRVEALAAELLAAADLESLDNDSDSMQ